jgi:hypothetical protein
MTRHGTARTSSWCFVMKPLRRGSNSRRNSPTRMRLFSTLALIPFITVATSAVLGVLGRRTAAGFTSTAVVHT